MSMLEIDERLYILLNRLLGHSPLFDTLIALPMSNNLVKVGPIGACFVFAWFGGSGDKMVRRRSILFVTLASLLISIAITKSMEQSIFVPRPMVRALPVLQLENGTLVSNAPLPFQQPLAGGALADYDALKRGAISASDLGSFPSDHAAMFFALSLGIALACRSAGIVAMAWTLFVILLGRVIVGRHSPMDIVAGMAIGATILFVSLFAARRWAGPALDRTARLTLRKEQWSSALLFLSLFEILSLLENVKQLLATIVLLLKGPARAILSAFVALLIGGCGIDQKGALFLLEDGWRAEILATEQSGIVSPDGLLWADDSLLIADEGGRAVRRWRPGQGFETLADGRSGIGRPEDIARDSKGNIYITDDEKGGVWRINVTGETVRFVSIVQGVGPTEGLAIDQADRLAVGDADRHRVLSIGPAGDVRTLIAAGAGISKPEGLALAPDGSLFIADNKSDALYFRARDGQLHRPISHVEGFSPESIFLGQDALFITDSENGKLYRYTPQSGLKPIIIFAGELRKVQGISGDPAGNLYVSIQTEMRGGRGYLIRLSRAPVTVANPNG